MNTTDNNEQRSWKQEPMVWLVIGIPATAVVVGMIMLTVSITTWSGLVVDDYYRKGKEINRVLARDQFAWELGLAAGLSLDDTGQVEIRFDPDVSVVPGERIELKLVHSTRPGLDQTLTFDNTNPTRLTGDLPLEGSGRWYVYLQTGDWRLTGSLRYPQDNSARLLPNYQPG